MRLAITQPNFLPWLGYFELLDYVDVWVSLDNVQLPRRSFVLRNRVRRPDGVVDWIGVSIKKCPRSTSIKDAPVASTDWDSRIIRRLDSYYRNAPFYDRFAERVGEILTSNDRPKGVAALNESIVHEVSSWLGIEYEFHRASDLEPDLEGSPQEKILSLIGHFSVDTFCNFARGIEVGLYDPDAFAERGVQLQKHAYVHPTYLQHGGGFEPFLSIIDLLFETGEGALEIIRSGRRWEDVAAQRLES
jgi:hypothetical protein